MFYRTIILFFGILVICGCSKKDVPTKVEDGVKFSTTPDNSNGNISITSDTLNLAVNINSKIPDDGFTVTVELIQFDNSLSIIKTEKSTTVTPVNFKVYPLQIGKSYLVKVTVSSNKTLSITSTTLLNVKRNRVYKNYLKTSYELSKYDLWLSSDNLFSDGKPYTTINPFLEMQTCQLDIDGDGLEDVFTYDSYPSNIPTPNPPPSVFMNNGKVLNKVSWSGPTMRNPHGVKLLVGDFNNDSIPDIFSLVDIDQPNGAFPSLKDFNNLLFNSPNGFNRIKEFDDQLGYWCAGCSGDIDNDGDLDVIMFNFHVGANGVKSKILWNDGKGNFTYDENGIGDIGVVDQAELVDINHDGFLDLVIDYITSVPSRIPHIAVMWGNGKGFSLNNSTSFDLPGNQFLIDIGFADIDNDGIEEIINSGIDDKNNYFIEIYKSDDHGKTFVNKTTQYVDNNISLKRFNHIRVQDIDKNGRLDIFSTDKKDNIRWEWNGNKFIKQ